MRYIPIPGESDLGLLIEGGESAYGVSRVHRKYDARWRRVAARLLEGLTPTGYTYLFLTGNVSNLELFDLNGRLYEFAAAGVPTVGDVGISTGGGVTAALIAPVIVAAVNADAARDCDALLLTAGGTDRVIAFIPVLATGDVAADGAAAGFTADAAATAVPMVNGAFRANKAAGALFDGDGNPAAFHECSGTHVVTAQDVARWLVNDGVPIAAVPFTTAPVRVQYTCMTAGSLVRSVAGVEFRWQQANTNRWVLECVDLTPVFVAGDFIHWTAST